MKWRLICPNAIANPEKVLTGPIDFLIAARPEYRIVCHRSFDFPTAYLYSETEEVVAVVVECLACGQFRYLPRPPYPWSELLCPNGCNWPKTEREAGRMVAVAQLSPDWSPLRQDAAAAL